MLRMLWGKRAAPVNKYYECCEKKYSTNECYECCEKKGSLVYQFVLVKLNHISTITEYHKILNKTQVGLCADFPEDLTTIMIMTMIN